MYKANQVGIRPNIRRRMLRGAIAGFGLMTLGSACGSSFLADGQAVPASPAVIEPAAPSPTTLPHAPIQRSVSPETSVPEVQQIYARYFTQSSVKDSGFLDLGATETIAHGYLQIDDGIDGNKNNVLTSIYDSPDGQTHFATPVGFFATECDSKDFNPAIVVGEFVAGSQAPTFPLAIDTQHPKLTPEYNTEQACAQQTTGQLAIVAFQSTVGSQNG